MLSALSVPLIAFANRMRGMSNAGKLVYAACMAGALFLMGVPYLWMAILAGLATLGASYGWTKWLFAMKDDLDQTDYNRRFLGKDKTGQTDGSFYIARTIANGLGIHESTDYKGFGTIGFFVRGLYWWVPFYVAVGWMQSAIFVPVIAAVASAVLLPVSYQVAYKAGREKPGIFGWKYLERAEPLYGLLYGLVMWFVLVWAPKVI